MLWILTLAFLPDSYLPVVSTHCPSPLHQLFAASTFPCGAAAQTSFLGFYSPTTARLTPQNSIFHHVFPPLLIYLPNKVHTPPLVFKALHKSFFTFPSNIQIWLHVPLVLVWKSYSFSSSHTFFISSPEFGFCYFSHLEYLFPPPHPPHQYKACLSFKMELKFYFIHKVFFLYQSMNSQSL